MAALTVAAVGVASSTASDDAQRNLMGSADAVVLLSQAAAANDDVAADALRRLPAGSRVLRVRERHGVVPGMRGSDLFVEVSDLLLDDPLTTGMTPAAAR